MSKFAAVLVGDESLLVQCGEVLVQRGHSIAMVVTQAPAIADWARSRNLDVGAWGDDLADSLRPVAFDWLFSIANLRLVPEDVLRLARAGAVNFHDGPLPRYAGLNTPSWAILEGARSHGVTWHGMTGGIDEGDILAARSFEIDADETVLTLNAKCFEAGIASFAELITSIENSTLDHRPQPREGRVLYRRSARPAGAGLLNLGRSSAELSRISRALDFGVRYANPLVVPKVATPDGIHAVERFAVLDEGQGARAPGTVIAVDAEGIVVATGDRPVRIEGRSLDSGKRLGEGLVSGQVLPAAGADFIRAIDEIVAKVVPHEAHWVSALANVVDLDPQWTGEVSATPQTIMLHLPESATLADMMAIIPAFLARLFAKSRYTVACTNDKLRGLARTSRGLVADSVPVDMACDLDLSPAELRDRLAHDFDRARSKIGFLTDIFMRRPDLPRPSLSIGIVETADPHGAAAISGCAITFVIEPDGQARAVCDSGRISPAKAQDLMDRLAIFAKAFVDGGRSVGEMPVASAVELQRLLVDFNETALEFDRDACVHDQFARQARLTPDAVAVSFLDRSVTYAQLDRAANSVAAALVDRGVGPDVPVGLHVRRSIELVIGALAILKAGGAYVPLDPDFPEDRLSLMVADSGAKIVLTERAFAPVATSPGVLSLDIAELVAGGKSLPARPSVGADNLAYIIYTSGSTGRPKGVMIEHRNVVNFFAGMDDRIPIPAGEQPVWLAVTSLSFDISVLELFWTLSRGFKVVIHASEIHRAHRISASPAPRWAPGARPMDFGLFYWGNDDGVGPAKYRLLLEGAKFADAHSFQSIWTPERHFHAFGGPYPNPAVTGAAVAAVTSNLEIRAGSCVLPLHHPIRIAEEWAVVDNLSNGRVALAFASGWMPEDFVLRPENAPPGNKNALLRDIETVRRLWRGDAVDFPLGEKSVSVVTQPRPMQAELPVWLTTAGNPASYREAAELGANVLTHLLGQSIDELAEKIAIYRATLAQAGRDPAAHKVTLMLHTLVGEDREEVRERAREPMKNYLRSAAALIKQYAWAFPAFKKPAGAANAMDIDLRDLAEDEMDAILEFAFLRYFEDSGLFGTIEDCQARVAQLAAIGVDEVACLIDFGVETDIVLAGLRPLAALVAACRDGVGETALGSGFAHEVALHGVTHLQCTPSMARMFLADADNRRAMGNIAHLMIGGEPLPGSLLAELSSATGATIENMYGPTETTIWSSTVAAEPTEGVVPIGRPIANTQFYVLDALGHPVPAGMAGELHIGGDGVARGYLGRPDLTAERFIANPFGSGRLYRTGDLVAFEPDGQTLRFLGRSDHQVKVRGYRIELGEIEARIQSFAGVAEAVVVAQQAVEGDTRIVGYLRVSAPVDQARLRAHLAQALPDYMVPSRFVELERFPLTPNAKVDRGRLPQVEERSVPAVEAIHFPPKDDRERAIADAFARVLGVERVGLADNFFALGGHSLLAVQVHRDLKASIAPELTITDLFRFPTVGALAAHLANRNSSNERLSSVADRAALRRARMQQGVGARV